MTARRDGDILSSRTQVFTDTLPETERALFAMRREMPPWRKVELVVHLNQTVRESALAGLRERYPNASPEELHRRLADIVLGPELAEKAYGPLTETEESHAA